MEISGSSMSEDIFTCTVNSLTFLTSCVVCVQKWMVMWLCVPKMSFRNIYHGFIIVKVYSRNHFGRLIAICGTIVLLQITWLNCAYCGFTTDTMVTIVWDKGQFVVTMVFLHISWYL